MAITLPSGYITLDSIRSTGSQYIALPYTADSGLAVTVEFDYWGSGALFGARDATNAITAQLRSNGSGTLWYGTREKLFDNFPSSSYGPASCRVYVSNSQMTVNNLRGGGRVNYDISPGSFETGLQLYLCAENYNGTARYKCTTNIYSVSINGYPLVPCMKADTGQPGLYDTRKGVFLYSASGEDFRAGWASKISLPSTYIKTDYIEATGTQYIDTGYIPNGNTRIVMDCESTDLSSTFCFFCARAEIDANDTASNTAFYLGGKYRKDFYGESQSTTAAYTAGTRFTIDSNKNTITFGSDYSLTFTASSNASPMPLILMASAVPGDTDGTVKSLANYARMKLYSCKIYNDGTLIRDFVPCINPSGVAGLWDKVTGTFYASANGTFTTGSKHKTLIDGTGYEIKSGRVLIAGTGYDVKKGRTLIDGTGYDIKLGTPVGELPVGTSVYMNVGGERTEFLIVHQGNPDSAFYTSGGEGTWLLEKNAYTQLRWSSVSDYTQTAIYTYGENTYFNLLDPEIKGIINPVTFKSPLSTETETITCKIFPLDDNDMNDMSVHEQHAALSYFANTADEQRIAYNNDNSACMYFSRYIRVFAVRPYYRIHYVDEWGTILQATGTIVDAYYRPTLVLPFDSAYVDDNFNIIPS